MSDLASRIERALRRLNEGRATAADMTLLTQAGRDGGLVLATGDRSVVIRGDVSGFATLTGDVKANAINLTPNAYEHLRADLAPNASASPPQTRKVATGWILGEVALAAVLAVLGKVLADYLQLRLSLPLVAVLFVACLALLLVVTCKKWRPT